VDVVLTLFHDFTDPASAVAVLRLQRLADEGLAVIFEGFEAGVDAPLPPTLDVLAGVADLAPAAAELGLVLRRPRVLPPTGGAHVVGQLAERRGLGASWRQVCYRAVWERGADVGDRQVLWNLAGRAGLNAAEVATALDDRALLASVRRRMASRRRLGVGGVPVILAGGTLVPGLLGEVDLRTLAGL
jgi:2-hydroxychromene-2-carboxylate isomerase